MILFYPLAHVSHAPQGQAYTARVVLRFRLKEPNLGAFSAAADPAHPVTYLLPTQLLTSQNFQPVTYQAQKPRYSRITYLAEF